MLLQDQRRGLHQDLERIEVVGRRLARDRMVNRERAENAAVERPNRKRPDRANLVFARQLEVRLPTRVLGHIGNHNAFAGGRRSTPARVNLRDLEAIDRPCIGFAEADGGTETQALAVAIDRENCDAAVAAHLFLCRQHQAFEHLVDRRAAHHEFQRRFLPREARFADPQRLLRLHALGHVERDPDHARGLAVFVDDATARVDPVRAAVRPAAAIVDLVVPLPFSRGSESRIYGWQVVRMNRGAKLFGAKRRVGRYAEMRLAGRGAIEPLRVELELPAADAAGAERHAQSPCIGRVDSVGSLPCGVFKHGEHRWIVRPRFCSTQRSEPWNRINVA